MDMLVRGIIFASLSTTFQLDIGIFVFYSVLFYILFTRVCFVFIRYLHESLRWCSAVDRGFEPQSAHSKDYEIDSCCFSANPAALKDNKKKLVGS